MSPANQRLAIVGGTFDPIHNGHLTLVETAREACQLDRVIFMPCAQSPFKESPPIANDSQRLEMIELALAERQWTSWASVSRCELDRPPPSYSWQTAQYFADTEVPGTQLYWILGGDQWEQIENWAEPERLRSLLNFIVVSRTGSTISSKPGWRSTLVEFDHPASATAIRAGKGLKDWLPLSVLQFCEEEGLYLDR